MPRTKTPVRRRRGERGLALVIALFSMAVLLMMAGSSLLVGGTELRATRNYRRAGQVRFAAEAGISHVVQVVNGPGILHFQNDVVSPWSTVFGTGSRNFAALNGFTYSVSAVADPADPSQRGWFVSRASGPDGARSTVVARINRSNIPTEAPGAIYLAEEDTTDADFNGNTFLIDGNDRNYTGGAGPGTAVPGLSTRNDTNTQEAINSLSASQLDNITGMGFNPGPPVTTSVLTSPAAPTVDQLNQMAVDLLLRPHVTNNTSQITGNAIFGTTAAPQITYFPQSTEIKGTGTASGAGILIVDGDLTIKGTLDFKGLIIVRGRTQVIGDTEVTGTATLYGSLWTNDINLVVGGSALVQYSTQALALANMVGGGAALPSPIRVTALIDCGIVPSGTNGCP